MNLKGKLLRKNGDIESTFTTAGTIEIKRWLHSWISNVEVLEPKRLRDEMMGELEKVMGKYK